MKQRTNLTLCRRLLLTLPCLATSLHAAVLVNLDATALPLGPLPTWTNTGITSGDFTATGSPTVANVAGIKAVTFANGADFYSGPVAPSSLAGVNPNRTIEVWAYNPDIVGEETLVAWGRRGGGDGTNLAFNYGNNSAFGAVGHWGGADLGWNNAGGAPAAGVWHYLVYTYDGGGAAGSGTTRVYADGVLQNSEFLGTLNTHDGLPFVIAGQNNDAGTPAGFNSGLSIARVRVHDTVMTGAEISAKYASELPEIYPLAFFGGSRVSSSSQFCFTIQDTPGSLAVPASFGITVGGVRAGWQVQGGEGVLNGSITTPAIPVPGGTVELTLRHRYNFEGDGTAAGAWDGGVVQVSINGGDFTTVEDTNFTQNGYFDLPLVGNHVLTGQLGFNGASPGFADSTLITSVATIPGVLPGDSIRLRFLGAWDEGFTPGGIDWEIAGVTVKAGAATVLSQDFTGGDGGFTKESTAPNADWSFIPGTQPSLGTLTATKSGGTTTLCQDIGWAPGRTYAFTITGKDGNNTNLSYTVNVAAPTLPLAAARTDWPVCLPGPIGTSNNWGVRTYLNIGLNDAQDLTAMLDFLNNQSADRTPALSPNNVVDSMEGGLNFYDPATNGSTNGVVGCARPFPGDALSTSTNGGTARDDDRVISVAHGSIVITEAGDYTFNLRGDDGFMFRIKRATGGAPPEFLAVGGGGQVDAARRNILFFPAGTGDADTRGVIYLTPGTYKLEYATWEGGGGFWYQVAAAKGFFVNNADTTTWALIGYQTNRTTPIPYPSIVGQWAVDSTLGGATVGTNAAADASVDTAVLADPVAARTLVDEINFQDDGGGGSSERIADSAIFPRLADAVANDNFALRATATLRIPEDGNYLIGFQGDDGSRLTVGGVHSGFSALTENATGASVIGRAANIVLANSGSLGAAANSANADVLLGAEGSLIGDTDKAAGLTTVAGPKIEIPYVAGMNPGADADPLAVAASFTVEAWAKPTAATGVQAVVNSMIAGANQNPGNANDRSGYVLRCSGDAWQFYLGNENVYAIILHAPATVVAGEWHHVVGQWDGTTARLYVNGVKVSEAGIGAGAINGGPVPQDSGTPRANYAAPLYIGKRGFGDWLFGGSVDEVAVYPSVLSEAVILSHKANREDAARTTPYATLVQASSPVAYYRLNEAPLPRVDLGTINCDVATGNSSTVGRIFLTAGDYPISTLFWEAGGGASYEVFAMRDVPGGCVGFKALKTGGWPSVLDNNGLALVPTPLPPAPSLVGGLTKNPDNTLSLTFQSAQTAVYQLEASSDLTNWQSIRDVEATGSTTTITGTAGEFFIVNPGAPKQFFRVRGKQ